MRIIGRSLAAAWAVAALLGLAARADAKDRALVVGVNHYSGITVGGVAGQKDLGGAVFDAKTFADLLKSQFGVPDGSIHLLTDADATHDRILDEFHSWLIGDTQPGDRVFFYFAGHGAAVRVTDEATAASRMTSAIVPSDAKGELADQPLDIKGMILGVEMRGLLDQMPGRVVTVVADSCQSGSVSRDALHPFIVPPTVKVRTLTPAGAVGMTQAAFQADVALRRDAKFNGRLLAIEGVKPDAPDLTSSGPPAAPAPAGHGSPAPDGSLVVWSAATTDQVTFDLKDRPGGVFTQNFADGLRDKKAPADADGHITAAALLNYVRDQAKVFCGGAGPACSAGLTPQLIAPSPYLTADITGTDKPVPASPSPPPSPPPSSPSGGPELAGKLQSVLSHTNDFSLKVDVLPRTKVKIGETISFRVQSAEVGHVTVFDLTPDGDLTQIFPNAKTDRGGKILPGTPLTMPDAYWGIRFHASPPAGEGALLVLVTEEGVDLTQATGLELTFKPVTHGSRLLQVVSDAISQPVISPKLEEPTRAARWAFARIPYTVVP